MSHSKKRLFAVASVKAFCERGGRILILRESKKYKTGSNHGRFVMPGGKVDEGEHFADLLRREVMEECGLRITIGAPFHTDEWRVNIPGKPSHIVAIYFKCASRVGKVKLNNEFDHHEWISPKDYKKYLINVAAKRAFKSYLEWMKPKR